MEAGRAARLLLDAGVRFFQYRNKRGPRRAVYETALALSKPIRGAGALFIVNDHADIALAVDADGAHLGQDDLPVAEARKLLGRERVIGVSTHDPEQAREARAAGADYIGFGPVFRSATKDAGPAQGLDGLRAVRDAVDVPIIAIGGIAHATIAGVIRAGADGAAVVNAVLGAPDLARAAADLIALIENTRREK